MVATAASVAAAVELAASERPDVVIMDDLLPDGDGVVAARRIRADQPEVKALILTGSGNQGALSEALEAGLVGCLEKTAALDRLAAAVRAVTRGEVVIESQTRRRLTRAMRGDHTELTRREREVLALLAEGLSNRAIAERLVLSLHTVRTHVQTILRKLDAHSKLEAVAVATRDGLLAR